MGHAVLLVLWATAVGQQDQMAKVCATASSFITSTRLPGGLILQKQQVCPGGVQGYHL
jgi:hypothetical protein